MSEPASIQEALQAHIETANEHLETLRTDLTLNSAAFLGVVVIGLAITWFHWSGLLIAGLLIGVISRSLPAAVLNAILFGAVVLVAFGITEGVAVLEYHELTPIIYVTVGSAFGLPIFGSLLRGVL